jgi:hypothetical protein
MPPIESISIIVGIVGTILGLISFFAAIIFYIQGNKLNRQSEKILSDISAKVNLIQGDYGKFVDKSFDLAAGNVTYVSDRLSEQMDILEASLKRSIKETIATLKTSSVTDLNQQTNHADLQTSINRLIEKRVDETRREATRIIELSGIRVSEEAMEHYIMRALRHDSILTTSIKDYLRSHCLEISVQELIPLLDNMYKKGLIEKDQELTSRLTVAKDNSNLFWRLTRAGQFALAHRVEGSLGATQL